MVAGGSGLPVKGSGAGPPARLSLRLAVRKQHLPDQIDGAISTCSKGFFFIATVIVIPVCDTKMPPLR